MSNSDQEEELAAIVDALLAVVLGTPEQGASAEPEIALRSVRDLPDRATGGFAEDCSPHALATWV